MERHQCTEDEAYRKLRRLAMDKNLKLSELAQRILDTADLTDLTNPPFFDASHKNSAMQAPQTLQFARKSTRFSWHINCKDQSANDGTG